MIFEIVLKTLHLNCVVRKKQLLYLICTLFTYFFYKMLYINILIQ